MKKQNLLDTINGLSPEIDLGDLFERLTLAEEIEKGLEQIETGQTVTHDQVVEYFNAKWGG